MSDDCILETRGLVKEFKGFVAVNGVNLQVRRGQIHALIGPNGAGKSTVLRTVIGLMPAQGGAVWWDGREITHWPTERRARAGELELRPPPENHSVLLASSANIRWCVE